jgi:hypothetical protein
MGYGLAELEILEYVMQKGLHPIAKGDSPSHFILLPFEANQETRAALIDEYFRSLGVEVLPYLRKEGHDEVIADVLERLVASLPAPARLEIEMERQLAQLAEDI